MSEIEAIQKAGDTPATTRSLANDLRHLGIQPGMTLLVHSSLSAIGWVCGGPVAVINALEEVLTNAGTLLMPAHSSEYSDPANWCNPPVPETWWPIIREQMPLFSPDITPTRGMGQIAETFRRQNGVTRSLHPSVSFAAWGKSKEEILQDHQLDFHHNEQSPLGRIYECSGHVLLLGVGYNRNTSLHLAEHKANYPGKRETTDGLPVLEDGSRIWKTIKNISYETDDFERIGLDFERTGKVTIGHVGRATAKLMNQRDLVDFATIWMEQNRTP